MPEVERHRNITKDADSVTYQYSDFNNDTIEYAVTHDVTYNRGEKLWVKFGLTSQRRADESIETAAKRVVDYVNEQVLVAIRQCIDVTTSTDTSA